MKNTLLTLKITLIQILTFLSFSLSAQCIIGGVTAEITACEGDAFDVSISFDYDNTSDQFTITGNGNNYGTFSYSELPIVLTTLQADCDTEYEFVVTDVNNNNCSDFVVLGTACCEGDCEIVSIDFGPNPICVDGFIVTEWLIDGENTSEVGYDIYINNDFLLFVEYSETEWYDFDIPDTGTAFFTIKACDNDNPDCCYTWELENPCFESEVCTIGDLSIDITDCIDNEFGVIINFEYAWTSDQFTVVGNGVSYGTFSYNDLPITIDGLVGNCSTEYEFIVTDVNNNDCSNFYELGTVCCGGAECDLFDLVIETSECDGGVYEVTFDFEYTGTTNNFFNWEIPGVGSGTAEFSDLPFTILVENTNTNVLVLHINENDNPDCSIAGEFENPCYESNECFIGELNVDVSECDGNFFHVVINFEYANTSDQFTVNGNGNSYGTFFYSDLPITIDGLESNCDLEYEFVVHDINNNDCASDIGIGVVCCENAECDLFDLVIETSECDGGVYEVTFDFEYTGTTNNFFNWEIPGVGSGTAEFSDLPFTILVENTNTNVLVLHINENDNPDCSIAGEFENPCYDSEECFIGELNVDVSECDGNFFFVVINFEYANTSDQFTVNGNGNSYGTFFYSDLPITIDGLESNCDLEYEFVVHDINNNDCASDIGVGVVCCENAECDLFDLVIETSECDGGVYEVTFDFEYTGTTNNFFNWEIPGVGSGTAEFSDLPFTILVESTNTNALVLHINENDNPDCSIAGEFENPCYDSEECFIGELNVDVSECDGNFFHVVINFEYANTSDQFTVNGNGNSYGTFSYSDLPITIDGLEANCDMNFEFVVHDINDNDCASDINIGEVCCNGVDCDLFDLVIETSECDGGVFFVTFDFEYTGTTNNFFDWEIPGIGSGFAEFGDLPLTIGIEENEMNTLNLIINENDNPDCNIEGTFENPCNDSEECFIGELNVDVSECDGNFFHVVINFEYANTSDQFTVNGNGNSYGTFSYSDLPITIDGLEANCDMNFEFVVHDINNDDCASDIGIGEVCCNEDPCDLFDLNFDVSECDGNFFIVEVDFEYTGNTNEIFDWEIPGVGSGTTAFADLPISIEIENTTDSQFTFFANENDNADCSIVGTFGNPCFDSEACVIDEVTAEVIQCEEDIFDVEINFEYANVGSTFSIVGNGVEYGVFEYSNLPIVITGLAANCELEYEFVIIDLENEGCSNFIEIGTICCDDFNQINGIDSETIIDGESFKITFNIDNTTLKDCNIEVYVGGELYTTLSSDESSFELGPFDCGQDNVIEIKLINTCTGEDLTFELDLSDIECTTDVNVNLDSIDLNWNMFQKVLSINGELPISVDVQLLNAQGALIVAQNGVSNGWSTNLEELPSGLYFVRVIDSKSTSKGFIRKILVY